MPTKHVVKTYDAPAFYHVYNRASGERKLFRDTDDRLCFLALLQKYLSENGRREDDTKAYDVQVAAYCLMGTHFHLLLYQAEDPAAITGYMCSVGTAYSMYYNKKYKSKGHVFQSSFRASHVNRDAYFTRVTGYIHLNPRQYETWPWSSYQDYIGRRHDWWVHPELVLEGADAAARYRRFMVDYAKQDQRSRKTDLGNLLA